MSDLLNNILLQTNQNKSGKPVPAIKIFDLNSQNKIQPLNPRGQMLKSRIIGSPVEYVKDLGKDIVSIKNGAKGKANDHELGRMNDLAMKTGSLALATYLFARNPLKLKRTMEFVGFGTFFASMALWPKLAIQAPLKARTGVDIHQKYQDSYGRKKMFFQDPQYIPWDLVNKEDLNKMGDRLNIPKDVKNRDEVIKQKAQKLAIQGNTLWMLTAGFATPLMSALSCNLAERAILPIQEKNALDKTAKMVDDPSKYVAGFKNKEGKKALAEFLNDNAAEPMNKDMANKIVKAMTLHPGLELEEAVSKDLLAYVEPSPKPIDDGFVKNMFNKNSEFFGGHKAKLEDIQVYMKSQGENLVVDEKNSTSFAKNFTEFLMKNKQVLTEDQEKNIESIIGSISDIEGATLQLKKDGVVNEKALESLYMNNREEFDVSYKSFSEYVKKQGDNFNLDPTNLRKIILENQRIDKTEVKLLNEEVCKRVLPLIEEHNLPKVGSMSGIANAIFTKIDDMSAQKKVIDKFVHVRVGDEAETFIANQWSRVNAEFIKALGITNKELETFKDGTKVFDAKGKVATDLIAEKLTALAKDEKKYEKAMKKVTEAILRYDDIVSERFTSKTASSVDALLNNSAIDFKFGNPELKLNNVADKLISPEINKQLAKFKPETLQEFMKTYQPVSLQEILDSDKSSISKELANFLKSGDPTNEKKLEAIYNAGISDNLKFKSIVELGNMTFTDKLAAISKADISEPLKLKYLFAFDVSGSMRNSIKLGATDRILGARASFYRMIQSMDLFKRIESGEIDKSLNLLKNMDFKYIDFKKPITPKDLLTYVKGEHVNFGKEGYDKLQEQLEKNFGIKCEVGESFNAYNTLLNDLNDDKKAEFLRKQFKDLPVDEMTAWVEKEMKTVKDPELSKDILDSWKKYTEQVNAWKPLRTMLETVEDSKAMKTDLSETTINNLKKYLSDEIIDKCKKTMLDYRITDQTEKLNDVGPKAYKTIMEILYRKDFDAETMSSLNETLVKDIKSYREAFIKRIANWESWYKSAHKLDNEATDSIDNVTRHLLVGSSVEEMIQKTSSRLFNTNKWLKMFGGAFAGLVGVTLVSELFFGKMKNEEVYVGDKK